jgi:hypothetical protein
MAIMENLMTSRPVLELDDKHRLYLRPVASGRSRVDSLHGHAFRKEVKLLHAVVFCRSCLEGNRSRPFIPSFQPPPENDWTRTCYPLTPCSKSASKR